MITDEALRIWFCQEVLPLEGALMSYIRRNWRVQHDHADLRQEVYERVLLGAAREIPTNCCSYLLTVARNHLISKARRASIVSFELVAEMSEKHFDIDWDGTERNLSAREELRRAQAGLEALPPRCRQIIKLRKVFGYSTKEVAFQLGIGVDAVEQQTSNGMRALADFMLGGSGKIKRSRLRPGEERVS